MGAFGDVFSCRLELWHCWHHHGVCLPNGTLVLALQVLKASAASQDELQQAEAHLQRAIAAAEQLAGQQDGLLLESNKACAAEAEAADAARSALAMLLCQSGREAQAAVHLAALGFKFRLSSEVRRS